MTLIIGCVSQKGGVGRSTLSRLLAREYAANDWKVKIADMDTRQLTSTNWNARRDSNGITPSIEAQAHKNVAQALRTASNYECLIFDSKPFSSAETIDIAKISDIVLIPSGYSLDDLQPTIVLANDLVNAGIPRNRIAVVFSRVGDSEAEAAEAKQYISSANYYYVPYEIPERTGYRRASDLGKALTETSFPSLNDAADKVVTAIGQRIEEIKKPVNK
jgi:chromosome partitioning protein